MLKFQAEGEIGIQSRTQLDLGDLNDQKMQGVIFRSGVKWYNEGEAMTRFFLNF